MSMLLPALLAALSAPQSIAPAPAQGTARVPSDEVRAEGEFGPVIVRHNNLDAAAERTLAEAAIQGAGLSGTDTGGPRIGANAQWINGRLAAQGRNWRAAFESTGFSFTPALGREAPRTRTIEFALESIHVGDTALLGLELDVEPTLTERTANYLRATGVTEQYEARPEGVKQSFVFESLPSRAGDLVVRGRLGGDFSSLGLLGEPSAGWTRDLRFDVDGIGELRIDMVVGIDATGREAEGRMRLDGDRVELKLPAEFVATAELPLVLDPLIGFDRPLPGLAAFGETPDIASSSFHGVYAITYERYFSSTDSDVYVGFYSRLGNKGAPPVRLDGSIGALDQRPSIAYQSNQETFLVVWQESGGSADGIDVLASTATYTSYWTSPGAHGPVLIAGGPGDQRAPDVGGEAIMIGDRCMVVYEDERDIFAQGVRVLPSVPPVPDSRFPLTTSSASANPAISKGGGFPGLYAVAWEQDFGTDRDIYATTVTIGGTTSGSLIGFSTLEHDESAPDVARGPDGNEWFVVFERASLALPGDRDIVGVKLDTPDAASALNRGADILIEADSFDDEHAPAVASVGGRYAVVWEDPVLNLSLDSSVLCASFDTMTCMVCEPEFLVSTSLDSNHAPAIAARSEVPLPFTNEAGIVWEADALSGPSLRFSIYAEFGEGSSVADLGGGCGTAGTMTINGNVDIGSPGYSVNLDGAPLEAGIAVLNYSPNPLTIPCGSCLWVPFKNTFVVPTVPDGLGGRSAQKGLLVPCLPNLGGVTFQLQWTVLLTNATPCPTSENISFSSILGLTLGY